jgi:hypothetical protein
LVGFCIRCGADFERWNCHEKTALGYAAAWASLEIVEALLHAGADVNAIERTADTALSLSSHEKPGRETILAIIFEVSEHDRLQKAKTE